LTFPPGLVWSEFLKKEFQREFEPLIYVVTSDGIQRLSGVGLQFRLPHPRAL